MNAKLFQGHGWLLAWLALVLSAYWVRGPLPIDETRYLSVAWEMWLRGDFLVPHLNGQLYSDKPPLLFWLFHVGWLLLGVNEWWPRLVPPLFALACLFLTRGLARKLWPQWNQAAVVAPWLLTGTLFWAFWTSATMFDMPLAAFVLIGIWGLLLASRERSLLGWGSFSLACAFGLLTKGPVMLLHVVFPALLAPWWNEKARRQPVAWYGCLLLAVLASSSLALGWGLTAAHSAGQAYGQAVLWEQTADRLVQSFAHPRPWWWYLPWLPLLLLPWMVWPPLWGAMTRLRRELDHGSRLCISWFLPTFAVLSLISQKQLYYLLPLLPAVALLSGRVLCGDNRVVHRGSQTLPSFLLLSAAGTLILLSTGLHSDDWPHWVRNIHPSWAVAIACLGVALLWRAPRRALDTVPPVALVTIAATALIQAGLFQAAGLTADVRPAARYLAGLQQNRIPIAHMGKYHGQYHFLGRLKEPLDVIGQANVSAWLSAHPKGRVVLYMSELPRSPDPRPAFVQPYRNKWLAIWPAEQLRAAAESVPVAMNSDDGSTR